MEQIKFTPEELAELKELRGKYSELSHELGQVALNRFSLDDKEKQLRNTLTNVQKQEIKLADDLKDKYGNGSIDIDTGVFIPNK